MSDDHQAFLLEGLTESQAKIVRTDKQHSLVIAGAGSGKTEVMARRIAWKVLVEKVPKENIVAFTFTEKAAEEMKFRIREKIRMASAIKDEVSLGGMYVGTIHGFCLKTLRRFWPDAYHHYDILDEASRLALVQRGYHNVLGLKAYSEKAEIGQYDTIDSFLTAYDFLNEYDRLSIELPSTSAPDNPTSEMEWCKQVVLKTNVGNSEVAQAFALSAARYYGYLHCRRFLDFSTSQSELVRRLRDSAEVLEQIRNQFRYIVVDEVQDINPVQFNLIELLVGDHGESMAVGDHRQAIYGFRGGKVELMGRFYEQISSHPSGAIFELTDNFRSTPRVIEIANDWSETISSVSGMSNPRMKHGRKTRTDYDPSHIGMTGFETREEEAEWIASTIKKLIDKKKGTGASHDAKGTSRGISYSDVIILIRSGTDSRAYADALNAQGIPVVFRAGPDLFSSEEVMLFVACMALSCGVEEFYGSPFKKTSFPNRIDDVLGCGHDPLSVIRASAEKLHKRGFPIDSAVTEKLITLANSIRKKVYDKTDLTETELSSIRSSEVKSSLKSKLVVRRVFTQVLYQAFLEQADVGSWDDGSAKGETALYHLGQLSNLIKQLESPGWTSPWDYRSQIVALTLWASQNARAEETELLLPPDAVTLSTIHGAKGLEFPVVFLADVKSRRFPSQMAKRKIVLPFDGEILNTINPEEIADNDNYDAERRLMYVGLTRAERYLFITHPEKASPFYKQLTNIGKRNGAVVTEDVGLIAKNIAHEKSTSDSKFRLNTSFSDIRYFLSCPHDFYLRKILGFNARIDQTFGYGKGLHNLMRSVHTAADKWAQMAKTPTELQASLRSLVESGLFYLRYTTGDIAENMKGKAIRIVQDYVRNYADELGKAEFDPEKDFETLIQEAEVLVSGAIDLIRLDDPPRVTLVDFKSGERDGDTASGLDEEEMQLQITLYGLAAKSELEYEPERGLIRYLGEEDASRSEVEIPLDGEALKRTKAAIVGAANSIRARDFRKGPKTPKNDDEIRCRTCDFLAFCGMKEAVTLRRDPR